MKNSLPKKIFLLTTFLCTWLGLIVIALSTFGYPEIEVTPLGLTNFFSYFTIQSNILVGLFCGYLLLRKNSFKPLEQTLQLGTLLDISITFIIYQTILAATWNPQGLAFVGNFFIHTLTPILFVVYWLVFQEKKQMQFKYALYWLVYPVLYVVYTLIRGAIVNWYPYPFLDASVISIGQVLINVLGITALFFVGAIVFVAVNNSWTANKK